MNSFVSSASLPGGSENSDLSELRQSALSRVLGAFAICAFVLLLLNGIFIAQIGVRPAYLALGLVAVIAASARESTSHVFAASLVLIIGLVGVLCGAEILLPDFPSVAALCLPVLIATVLIGTGAGIATLLLGGSLLLSVALNTGTIPSAEYLWLSFGLGSLVLICSITLWRSFYTVLDWSWASYEQAQRHSSELRERQAELGRLNQSLVLAYEQIKQTSAHLERARQTAEEARRLKSEFAANVSHELRTPLNLIIGLSELMVVTPHAGAPALPDVYRADVEAIYRNACHISNLIDDVLDLSQIEAHRMGLLKEWVSLHEIVSQATTTVRTLFENTGLSLTVCLPDEIPPLFVDPVRVRQVLINLLNNAVRFTEEGGITIRGRIQDDQVVVDVADTGTGISESELREVFQEFSHSSEPRRGRRGSGLGLTVSKRFIELHGGNMWVESTLGIGSTFSFAVPIGSKSVVQEAELAKTLWQRLEQQSPSQPSILLVDPEPESLRAFQRYLDGYHVAVVPDASSTVEFVGQAMVEAIIVGTSARRDLVQRALSHISSQQLKKRVPVITARLRTSKTIARELGVQEYLVKPVTQQHLQRAFRRFGRAPRDLLIVDDDPEMLHLLTRMVGVIAPRCHVRTASNGWEALELLNDRVPSGLLLDLIMVGLDGRGVLAKIKSDERLAKMPVIVVSAHGDEDGGVVADTLEIALADGLRIGELCQWIRAGLDVRQHPSAPAAATKDLEVLVE